jgi:hypothetical protein
MPRIYPLDADDRAIGESERAAREGAAYVAVPPRGELRVSELRVSGSTKVTDARALVVVASNNAEVDAPNAVEVTASGNATVRAPNAVHVHVSGNARVTGPKVAGLDDGWETMR